MLLLQHHAELRKFLVDADRQVFHSERARDLLGLRSADLLDEELLLVRTCLKVWLETYAIDLHELIGGLLSSQHLEPAISAVKYYLLT